MNSLVVGISAEKKLSQVAECPSCLLINEWLSSCKLDGLTKRTLADYQNKIDKFEWWWHTYYAANLGSHPRNFTTKHARAFASYLRESRTDRWGQAVVRGVSTLSGASVGSYGCVVKALFNWLERENHIERTPFNRSVKFTSRHSSDQTIHTVPTVDLARIMRYLNAPERLDTFEGKRDLAIITLLIDTGIRRGELLSITSGTMYFSSRSCKVKGKTGKRIVPFTETCQKVLESYYTECVRLFGTEAKEPTPKSQNKKALESQPLHEEAKHGFGQTQQKSEDAEKLVVCRVLDKNNPFWLTNDGTPLTYYGFSSIIRRVRDGSGVDFHAHELRHTFATLMIKQGVPLIDLKDLMGHASVTTTEIYIHQDIAHLAEVQAPNSPLMLVQKLVRIRTD